jgi:hypothetical protein
MRAVELEVPSDALWGVDGREASVGRPLQWGYSQHTGVGGAFQACCCELLRLLHGALLCGARSRQQQLLLQPHFLGCCMLPALHGAVLDPRGAQCADMTSREPAWAV